MGLPNKGITKAVTEAFINGTHDATAMLTQVSHLVTDNNRKAYIIHLTKTLREKYGMKTKRNKHFDKKKTGATKKPTQLALDFKKKLTLEYEKKMHPNGLQSPARATPEVVAKISTATLINRKYTGFYGDGDVTAYEHSVGFEPQPIVDLPKADRTYDSPPPMEDDITAEYVRLDDEHKVALGVIAELTDRNKRFEETNINLMGKIEEFKSEITRLSVIISYLEGKK